MTDDALLRPPQFSLRTLLIAVAVIAVLCSLVQWLSPAALLALGLLIAAIVCHVAGNAIGTHLRRIGSQRAAHPGIQHRQVADSGNPPLPHGAPVLQQPAIPAPGCLSERRPLHWPLIAAGGASCLFAGVGGVLGAQGGGAQTLHPEVVAVGMIAFAVLGGLATFATVALVQVVAGALWQASRPPPDQRLE